MQHAHKALVEVKNGVVSTRTPLVEPITRVKMDATITRLRGLWKSISGNDPKRNYHAAVEGFQYLSYDRKMIEEFCLEMAELAKEKDFREKAGAILSAMINVSGEKKLTLQVDHLKNTTLLFYRNKANINVLGNVHADMGQENEGIIFVSGSVTGNVGKRNRGEINVEKDVYGRVGQEHDGGKTIIMGNAGVPGEVRLDEKGAIFGNTDYIVGLGMKEGHIEVFGEAGLVAVCQKGGRITVRRAGSYVGIKKKGGITEVLESCDGISPDMSGGEVYVRGKRVYPYEKNGAEAVLTSMMAAWRTFEFNGNVPKGYLNACRIAKKVKYDAADVRRFTEAIGILQDEKDFSMKAGIFVSALVNSGMQKYYTVDFRGLRIKPSLVGYRNSKRVRVKGEVGPHAAKEQLTSTMIFEDKVGYGFGAWKKGGNAFAAKGAGPFAAFEMNGGKLTILRNAGKECCHGLKGGEVRIFGNVESFGNTKAEISASPHFMVHFEA